jgi:hypothetical protein
MTVVERTAEHQTLSLSYLADMDMIAVLHFPISFMGSLFLQRKKEQLFRTAVKHQ